MSVIQLTRDELPSARKIKSALESHSALNDHRTGGYNANDIMA